MLTDIPDNIVTLPTCLVQPGGHQIPIFPSPIQEASMAVVDARTTITLSKISCTSKVVMIPPSLWGISDLRGYLIYPPDENPLRMKWDTVTNKIGQGPKMELFPPLQEDTIFTCLTVLLCILILILMFSQLSQAVSALTWVQQQ